MTDQPRTYEELQQELALARTRIAELETTCKQAQQRADLLQRLALELTQGEQRERQQLAKTLHDHLQQLLVGAKFNLGILRGQIQDRDQRGSLDQVSELLDESVTASRSLTQDLSPPVLHGGTFAQVLQWFSRWAMDKHGLTVRVSADDEVDTQSDEIRVLLFQTVRELLLNVVKHAKVDGATITMDRPEVDQIQITVADEGVGFDPATFEGNPADQSSSGLGLFSIRQRLALVGGLLHIDSKPGQGTRVTLVAPTTPPARPAGARDTLAAEQGITGQPVEPALAGRKRQTIIRVLLADDHAVVRNGLARILQAQTDIEVVGQAADGLQVVQMALKLKPDIILMDVSMPYLSGVDVTRRLTQELPGIRVIGLSMYGQEDVAASMTAAGAAAYLTKTAPPETLIATIRECAAKPGNQPGNQPGT